jgi:predicted RNA-binding protein with RPS1 domain
MLRRAIWLSEQTDVAKNAIISWGFVEIVSTGIHLAELGYVEEAKDYLQLGEAVEAHILKT